MRSLRAPFVAVIATLGVACDDNACPEQRPEDGDPCSGRATCDYCVRRDLAVNATCGGTRWRVTRADYLVCPGAAPATDCVAAAPRTGERCSPSGAQCGTSVCGAGAVTGPIYVSVCVGGYWTLSQVFCNPAPPDAASPDVQ
jgi:hypothetical protein